MKRFPWTQGARRSGGSRIPKAVAPRGLDTEQERQMEADDLSELLAATNAKRAARGKRQLSQDDVAMQVWAAEQEMRTARER